ncbi:MAG: hypothetical protein LW623_02770 [Sphingomonadaceae bacterium]|uniref:hypothetical protein n=1 Tax=Sphingorhabdus sp. TaxID=1902408 RepID=UPI0039BC4610|nr:hypothetical protein [Sphingomonadaceae bacterium]
MRLSDANLAHLPVAVTQPAYDRSARGVGIVHFGIGAFHRAHQAVYTDDAMAAESGDWGILGVSLRSANVRDQMRPQDGLYALVEQSADGSKVRVIGSVADVIVAAEERDRLIAALANPASASPSPEKVIAARRTAPLTLMLRIVARYMPIWPKHSGSGVTPDCPA